ncbi:sensor histidine kinase [Luteolibacter soli]|uniref:histidine kinase n=1 Tax=Luteolibacter soli TaxID=3135280 RepID=A0ABU9AXV9_9BACT
MRNAPPPWAWTLAVSALLAAMVAGAGIVMARKVEHFAEKPPGNRVDDSFREVVRRIDAMEQFWEQAIASEAERMLGRGMDAEDSRVAGVVQCSWLNPNFNDPERSQKRFDGGSIEWRPVLDRQAKGEPGEWKFSDKDMASGSGWIETPGRPLAWRMANGRNAVVLQLDPVAAVPLVLEDLAKRNILPEDEAGSLTWTSPFGKAWHTSGEPNPTGKPDEILRHVSRFGDWALMRHYPVRTVVSYRMPVLAGAFSISALLIGGAVAVASWQRKAIRLAEERVSFVNRVSHELRTPLTNLLLNTDLALDGLPVEDAKVRRRLGLIREETSRLSRIVDNVLAFARIERGTAESHATYCNVGQVVGEVRENFAPLFQRKSIVCDYDEVPDEELRLDRDALSQILSNLLSNVEKYAGEGARATMRFTVEASTLLIEVEDDGPGVPPDARRRIFQPFERAGSRVDEGVSGTGLGLAISRELAERMGGRLDLMDAKRGAKFRLVIPMGERSHA